ncbi:hypothetical protein A2W24_01870 [Microgenomates group bacterium RBG_16_45_19]|nr:MAG: hypothetical protein A2W24_01870 [Microgenomates group bacterium RBG_16_45_19]
MRKSLARIKLRRRGSFAGCTTISLVMRPYLEKDRFKALLGAPIMVAVIAGALPLAESLPTVTAWEVGEPLPEVLTVDLVLPSEANQTTSLVPASQLIGLSQGFHSGHPGLDLRAPLGSPIVAMRAGKVVAVESSPFGYGQHLYLEHSAYLTTMYAHVDRIKVRPGDLVAAGDPIAVTGLTGWSTGPHLHFEVYQEDQAVNPLIYLQPELKRLAINSDSKLDR